jgi:hypothetical protein
MGRKGQKNARKTSYNEGQNRVRYQEKPAGEWKCGVCDRKYDQNQTYCESCYQELFYYCYINNQLFVTKDDSYLEIYFHQQHIDDSFSSYGEEDSSSSGSSE